MVKESERSETSGGSSEGACLTCLPPHVIGTGRLDALHSGTRDLGEGLRVDKQSRERDTENVLEFQGRRQLHY